MRGEEFEPLLTSGSCVVAAGMVILPTHWMICFRVEDAVGG
jgi:hypothetical protein